MEIRLQKYLAEAGIASRRKSEEIILQGRVTINGELVTQLGTRVYEGDIVCVDNKEVKIQEKPVYIMLHKPTGCVATVKDQFERKTVLDYINIEERVYPVGRLDYDTSGLLILTNDGALTYKLTHPKHNVEKTYIAKVFGVPTAKELESFRNGLEIEDYVTAPAKISVIKKEKNTSILKISITEGRNRQVRKMCNAINHKVITLKRISEGGLELGNLEKGEYRFLTQEEIKYLQGL